MITGYPTMLEPNSIMVTMISFLNEFQACLPNRLQRSTRGVSLYKDSKIAKLYTSDKPSDKLLPVLKNELSLIRYKEFIHFKAIT